MFSNFVRIAIVVALAVFTPSAAGQLVVSDVGDGIVRIDRSPADASAAKPSVALDEPRLSQGLASSPVPMSFASDLGGDRPRTVIRVGRTAGDSVYGTGLVSGPLERTGREVELWNTDAFGWNDGSRSLYQSHPWVVIVHADGSATGVLFDSPNRMRIVVAEDEVVASVPALPGSATAPSVPVYVIDGAHPAEVMTGLAELTGYPFMPPLWSLGYHQSRYSYDPQARVIEIAQEFRNRDLPADVIWIDIDYMDGFRQFTWDPIDFPNPAGMDAALDQLGFKSIAIIDPHIKTDPNYFVFQQGNAGDFWVKTSDGVTPYVGNVWPGASVFPDYTRQDVRTWWAGLYEDFIADGIDGIWNDMNEPAVFNGEKTMPEDNVHDADAALGGTGPHARYHNVWGMQFARSTRAGLLDARPNERPFVLTRANHIGGHRYAATWTGDNLSDWYHLDVSIQNVLNMGLSGQPNVGPDIGGFIGSNSGEFFARWMGFGALFPFARGHTGTGNPDKEPWVFGDDVTDMNRVALRRRYRLLPHLYTLFEEAHRTGMPVARPLFFADPADPALRTLDDAFLLGKGLVVAAATSQGTPIAARPPLSGPMYRFGFDIDEAVDAASDICFDNQADLYLRGGHIVPSTRILRSTEDVDGAARWDEVTLLVALDDAGVAMGELYEDDGRTFGFESGGFLRTTYQAVRTGDSVAVSVLDAQGNLLRPSRPLTVRLLLGDGAEVSATGVDGQDVVLTVPADVPTDFECDPEPQVDPALVDGLRIPEAFGPAALRAVQTLSTNIGDNVNELNTLYVRADEGALRVGIPGNLAEDGHALALFVDSVPGGQAVVNTQGSGPPPAGLSDLSGTRFDAGFVPDRLFFVNAFNGSVFADGLELTAGQPAFKRYLGQGSVGSGEGQLFNGDNPFGVEIALDNSNFSGVGGGQLGDPLSATRGFEMRIPFAALGLDPDACAGVGVFAALIRPWGELSPQVLPGLDIVVGAIGVAPDLSAVPGEQFVRLGLSPADIAEPFGVFDLSDVDAFLPAFVAGDAAADLAAPAGVLDLSDIDAFISAFLAGCP